MRVINFRGRFSTAAKMLLILCYSVSLFFAASATLPTDLTLQSTLPTQSQLLLVNDGDLKPLRSAKEKLETILTYLNSPAIMDASAKSPALGIVRGRLLTSLFHLNLVPEIADKNKPNYHYLESKYPYDPVYNEPFPKRPSLEAMQEAIRFANLVAENAGALFDTADVGKQVDAARKLIQDLTTYGPYKQFSERLNKFSSVPVVIPQEITKEEILRNPVDSYFSMRQRLQEYSEVASFPEFAHPVVASLKELLSDEIQNIARTDPIFKTEADAAIAELQVVMQPSGEAAGLQAAFNAPYPYRRTLNAIELAVQVFDMKERLIYPESKDWYEVESSWYTEKGEKHPKLLPLYHFNRYKYQQFGLLSNPDIVLIPWEQDATMEDLIRLRPVPIGLIGLMTHTVRIDRHHNTPLDFWYHDINHIRRMWGYDKQRMQSQHLGTFQELQKDMKSRQALIEDLLRKTDPEVVGLTEEQKQLRSLERFIIFESFHETALSGTKEALLNDLTRGPATPQPFEVQIQGDEYFKELNRSFDGNLKSGADALEVIFSEPTKIQYFFDRAPGFLSNVYNKISWGFYGSVFDERKDPQLLKYRTPEYLAKAITNLFKDLGYPGDRIPPMNVLINEINDRSGQPELYNYFALHLQDDQSEAARARIRQAASMDIVRPEIRVARALKQDHPEMSPAEVAKQVMTTQENKDIIRWMLADLENYDEHFDEFFDAKLGRGDPRPFKDAKDYVRQFVGSEKGKLLATEPSSEELRALDSGGTLYVDTWAVPFFNTATQTREQAHEGIKKALAVFKGIDLKDDISIYKFVELLALYARPEFDDVRRYKLQLFPSENALKRYGKERNDAKTIGDGYPKEAFIVTTNVLSLDELSFTFGRRIHYMGLIPHSETVRADSRLFVGTADFFEHDNAHGYFSLELPVPGEPEQWIKVHEEYRSLQAKIADPKRKLMNSLVYFHFTHESAYKSMIPDTKGNPPKPDAYKEELALIKKRIETPNDYDWIKKPENIGENYGPLLDESFETMSKFFKEHLENIQSGHGN